MAEVIFGPAFVGFLIRFGGRAVTMRVGPTDERTGASGGVICPDCYDGSK